MKAVKRKRRLFLAFISLFMIIIFTSCGGSAKNKEQTNETSQNGITQETIETKSNEATIIVEDTSNQ